MSNGWGEAQRLHLAEPWQDFWVEVYEEYALVLFLDFQDAVQAARRSITAETITAACRCIEPFIQAHNLTDRNGEPLTELSLRTLSGSLFQALLLTVDGALSKQVPQSAKREPLRGPSSPDSRPRRASRSGSSPG